MVKILQPEALEEKSKMIYKITFDRTFKGCLDELCDSQLRKLNICPYAESSIHFCKLSSSSSPFFLSVLLFLVPLKDSECFVN